MAGMHKSLALTLHLAHPATEGEAEPGGDRGVERSACQAEDQREPVLWVEEEAQARVAVRWCAVVEVHGAKEAVGAVLAQEEVGEGPLDGEEDGGEDDS